MNKKHRRCLSVVVLGLFVLAAHAPAQFDRTALLIDAPTADVLPRGSLALTLVGSYPLPDLGHNYPNLEAGAGLRFSPFNRFELALTAYTLQDYVLGASYQILSSDKSPLSLALGVHDIGLHSYVSPVGHGLEDAWPDWKYENRQMERPSPFVVASVPLFNRFVRVHAGIGRGRNIGYGSTSKYLNLDILFDEQHQWAVGLFGGLEINFTKNIGLALEAQGRDANAGIKLNFGPLKANLALTKIEGLIFPKDKDDKFGRVALGLTYQIDNLLGPKPPAPSPYPAPEVVPETVAVETVPPTRIELANIYFDFDKSDIRPGDAEILRGNAEQISSLIKAGKKPVVTIEGHCCPIGTSEYNMALGWRRAESAKGYLVNLGIDAGILKTISYGEERIVEHDPAKYYLNRRCEFKLEYK
ncbi:MAG: OmpA family protein [candidate division WOR-3 bacterium]